jgi:MYXO-CTERM domain-containing protein
MRLPVFMLASIALLSLRVPLRADLITNGSFESPTVPVGGFTNFGTGSTGITGWTVVGPEVSVVSGSFTQNGISFPAEDVNQWVDLTGFNANSVEGVEQTVNTSPGTIYTLSFWVGNVNNPGGIFGTTSTVNVRLGSTSGTLLGSFVNNSTTMGTQVWQQFTTQFTASGTSTTLLFLNGDPSTDNSNGLDNVSLVPSGTSAVPEPHWLSLAALMIGGLALLRRRRTPHS